MADGKRVIGPEQALPVVLRSEGGSISVLLGPVRVQGRSVGRSKARRQAASDPLQAPFCVPVLRGRVKPGDRWKGILPTYPPLPASMQASFRAIAVSSGEMRLAVEASTGATRGGGLLAVTVRGAPVSGSLKFETVFRKPSPDDRRRVAESRVRHLVRIVRPSR